MWNLANNKSYRNLLVILILIAIAAPLLVSFAAPQSASTNDTIVLKDVHVIDGSGASPMEHVAIV
jgi:hypothetical protein